MKIVRKAPGPGANRNTADRWGGEVRPRTEPRIRNPNPDRGRSLQRAPGQLPSVGKELASTDRKTVGCRGVVRTSAHVNDLPTIRPAGSLQRIAGGPEPSRHTTGCLE